MIPASAEQFRCPVCESPRFKPVPWAAPAGGSASALYECASCSFTFTDPMRFARRRAAPRAKSSGDARRTVALAPHAVPRDRRIVNLDDEEEVHYWCRELQCNEWRLRDAVSYVGASAEDIRGCISRLSPHPTPFSRARERGRT